MSRKTSFLQMPFPSPLEEPWQDNIDAFINTLDAELFSCVTDRNLFLTGGGIMLFDSATNTLSWTDPIQLTNFVTGFFEEIPAGSTVIQPGNFLYTVFSRGMEEVTGTINLTPAVDVKLLNRPRGEFHLDVVICANFNGTIFFRNGIILPPDTPLPVLIAPPMDRRHFNVAEFRSFQHLNDHLMGTPNGVREIFGICRNVDDCLSAVYLDGLRMIPGVDFDILACHRIKFTPAPALNTQFVLDDYEKPVLFEGTFEESNIWAETPDGVVDGVNATFTLCFPAVVGTPRIYLDGMRMKLGTDYTILDDSNFLFSTPPTLGSVILVDYIMQRTGTNIYVPLFVWNEVPSQATPTLFNTSLPYAPGTTQLYLDGMRMKLNVDYQEGPGNTNLTFATAPVGLFKVVVDYMKL